MRSLFHPSIDEVSVDMILHALADPVRAAIYAQVVGAACPQSCSSFLKVTDKVVPKSTLSQHFKVLREAGLIRSERRGVEMQSSSRCAEIEERFPGLLPAILNAHRAQPAKGPRPGKRGERKRARP